MEHSLLRLGGRLYNAILEYNEKHPITLPKHRISELLIDCAHRATLHGGTQLTLHHLRQKYWIIGNRNLVKAHIRRCVICARQAAKASTQLMETYRNHELIPRHCSLIPAWTTPDRSGSYRL